MPTNKTALEMLIERIEGCKTSGKEDLGEFLKGAFWAFDVSIELANQTLPTERRQIEEAFVAGGDNEIRYRDRIQDMASFQPYMGDPIITASDYFQKTFKTNNNEI